jgi:hypothetical protein
MEELYAFIEACCLDQGIDDSHGLKHAKSCLDWFDTLLIHENEEISEEEHLIGTYSIALHDMCDHKYTNVDAAVPLLHMFLVTQIGLEYADVCIAIITSMSYSKMRRVNGAIVFPDHGRWQRVYHLVRHADLLDAYNVGRCFAYTRHSQPLISDETCWNIVQGVFDNRIFKYVSDGCIFLHSALCLILPLEEKARIALSEKDSSYV